MDKQYPDLILPADLAGTLADYLMTKPYKEVAGLLTAMANLAPVPEEVKNETTEDK